MSRGHARRSKLHLTFPGQGFSLTEGDLIIGRKNLSAIGTLVERTTNYTMLLHLPDGYTPELVRDALAAKIKTLPDVLRASLTWDQGPEMGKWKQVAVDGPSCCSCRSWGAAPTRPHCWR